MGAADGFPVAGEGSRPPRTRAFSLIELLVVLAVISLLTAVLLAAVTTIRQRASQAVCGQSIKAWGMALMTYSTEQNGDLPDIMYDGANYDPTHFWLRDVPGRMTQIRLSLFNDYLADPIALSSGALSTSTVVTIPASIKCPRWKPLQATAYSSSDYWYTMPGYTIYTHMEKLSLPAADAPSYTQGRFEPNRLLMTDWVYNWYSSGLPRFSHARNNLCSGQNQLRGDGSVAWRSYTVQEASVVGTGGTSVPNFANTYSRFYR